MLSNELFEMFCLKNDKYRTQFATPFIHQNRYVATDAYSIIIIPIEAYGIELPYRIDESTAIDRVIPFERYEPVEMEVKHLKDQLYSKVGLVEELVGGYTKECKWCLGKGEMECNLNHVHICEHCDGEGYEDLPIPTGEMIPNPEAIAGIHKSFFFVKQIARLIKASEMLGADKIYLVSEENFRAHLFLVDKAQVVIMPVQNYDSETHVSLELKKEGVANEN